MPRFYRIKFRRDFDKFKEGDTADCTQEDIKRLKLSDVEDYRMLGTLTRKPEKSHLADVATPAAPPPEAPETPDTPAPGSPAPDA